MKWEKPTLTMYDVKVVKNLYSYSKLIAKVEITNVLDISGDRGSTVVKVLCYKSEGPWLDPSWCQWNFSLT